MKLGFITDKIYPFYVGGYETRFWELARRLSGKFEVHVFTSCPENTVIHGIHFHRIVPHIKYVDEFGFRLMDNDFFYSLMLFRKLFARMDFIDCNATPFIYIPVAKILSKISRAKLAVTVHEVFLGSLADVFNERMGRNGSYVQRVMLSSLPYRFIKWSLKLADHVIAVSEVTRSALVKGFGLPNSHVVPNGVSIKNMVNIEPSFKKGNVITFLGRLSPEKNVEDLLKAVGLVKRNGFPDVFCSIIGDGPSLDSLRKLVYQEDISENVCFHGFVPDPIKHELLSSSDLFILPSKREGFSIASLEAMGSCLPVIAAKPSHCESSGVFEFLKEGYNGLSYPLSDYKELASRISTLFEKNKLRVEMGANAYSTAKSYSWDKSVEKYMQLIEE